MKRKIIENKTLDIEYEFMRIFDVFEESKRLFVDKKFYEGFLYTRKNTDLSEISNSDIFDVLKGKKSVVFFNEDLFDIIDKPDLYQQTLVNKIQEEYNNLIQIQDKYYKIEKTISLDFFESISPRKFKEEHLFKTNEIKSFIFDIPTNYFIIEKEELLFVKEFKVEGFNPFL